MKERITAQMQGGFLFCQAIRNIQAIDRAEKERKIFCLIVKSHELK